MSVHVNIKTPALDSHDFFPIAGQAPYDQYWVPAAKALGLVWIPAFSWGTSFSNEDAPAVIAEFKHLKDSLLNDVHQEIPREYLKHEMLRVIDRVVLELDKVKDVPNLDVFIG